MPTIDLVSLIPTIGYLGVAAIVFAESGLLIGFFLPGDSLLFTAGFLASQGTMNVWVLALLCFIAAVTGDATGYYFGHRVGRRLFERRESLVFRRERLLHAEAFFDRHGGKAVVLARFVPVVRTFVPVVAGMGAMHYPRFAAFNILGGLLWAVGLTLAGYVLGQSVPGVDRYLLPIVLVIIVGSLLPGVVHLRPRRQAKDQGRHRL